MNSVKIGSQIVCAMMNGQLTAEIASRLFNSLNQQAKLVELIELEQRVAALEVQSNHD